MSHRTFLRRRNDRIDRLCERLQFLTNRLCRPDGTEGGKSRDRQERSALYWVLEEIERMDRIEDVVNGDEPADVQVHVISGICEERWRPTPEDLERTPGLVKSMEPP